MIVIVTASDLFSCFSFCCGNDGGHMLLLGAVGIPEKDN